MNPPVSPAATTSPTEAERAYDRAIAFYAAGNKLGALEAMQAAYLLSRHPDLLYNLGKLDRELGRCRPALSYYRAYAREAPNGAFVGASHQAIGELEAECEPPAPAPQYWTPRRIIGWSVIATGVAAEAGALAFQLAARSDARDEQAASHMQGIDWEHAYRAGLAADREQTLAVVFAAAGAAFITGGALCLTLKSTHHEGPPPGVALALGPGTAYMGYQTRF